MNAQELKHNTIRAEQAYAENIRAYVDQRTGINIDQQLERRLDALLKSKLGAALLSRAQPTSSPTVNSALPITPQSTVVNTELTPQQLKNLAGMNPKTGKIVRGLDYLKQRIADALSTPKYSQVILRERGGYIFDLIDSAQNNALPLFAAVADTLQHPLSGVPDFALKRVQVLSATMQGKMGIEVSGEWLGQDVEIIV